MLLKKPSKNFLARDLFSRDRTVGMTSPILAGGGKPENAQASGTNPAGTSDAIRKAVSYAMEKLGVTEEPALVAPGTSSPAAAAPASGGDSMQAKMV